MKAIHQASAEKSSNKKQKTRSRKYPLNFPFRLWMCVRCAMKCVLIGRREACRLERNLYCSYNTRSLLIRFGIRLFYRQSTLLSFFITIIHATFLLFVWKSSAAKKLTHLHAISKLIEEEFFESKTATKKAAKIKQSVDNKSEQICGFLYGFSFWMA